MHIFFIDRILAQVSTADAGKAMLDEAPGSLPIVADARWSEALTGNSWGALIAWLILMVVLQAVSWPLVRVVFRRFPDRGWGFARLTTMIVAGYLLWLPASLEIIEFRAIWCAVAVAILAVLNWTGLRRLQVVSDAEPWYRNRTIAGAETAFWAVFGLFLLFRLINHDSYHPVYGGEKPMEFAHFNAILRSPYFPPVDPWYSGGALNYYYYGTYLAAFLTKLTGIPSEIAYNLAQPMFMGLLASGAWSVSAALARFLNARKSVVLLTGAIGTVMMVISGNLIVATRLVAGIRGEKVPWSSFEYWVWIPTRVLPDWQIIHEVPYFTGLYADLHAHGMALPMTVLLIGLCLSLVAASREFAVAFLRPRAHLQSSASIWITMMTIGLVFATIYMTNAWDVPTYAAVICVSLVVATRAIRNLLVRVLVVGAAGLSIAALTYALVTPFRTHYVTLYGDIAETRTAMPVPAFLGQFGLQLLVIVFGLAWLVGRDLPRPPLVLRPLVMSSAIMVTLFARWYAVDRSTTWIDVMDGLVVLVPVLLLLFGLLQTMPDRLDAHLPGWVGQILTLLVWGSVTAALVDGKAVLALCLGLGGVTGLLWLSRPDRATRFAAGLIAGGFLVAGALELVYLVDDLQGGAAYRMNTVFKFYMAVWTLLTIGAAALIALMAEDAASVEVEEKQSSSPGWTPIGLGISVLAILASLAFPIVGTASRLDQQFEQPGRSTTLNSLDWMTYGEIVAEGDTGRVPIFFDEDRQIIDWFNSEVEGTPVIAEANIGTYRCAGNRISIQTGLPTVVGWTRHESQQRPDIDLGERRAALFDLYTSTDPATKISVIDRYGIQYVVVGQLERIYPAEGCTGARDNAEGVSAFESLVGTRLEVAFQVGDSIVYRVIGN